MIRLLPPPLEVQPRAAAATLQPRKVGKPILRTELLTYRGCKVGNDKDGVLGYHHGAPEVTQVTSCKLIIFIIVSAI